MPRRAVPESTSDGPATMTRHGTVSGGARDAWHGDHAERIDIRPWYATRPNETVAWSRAWVAPDGSRWGVRINDAGRGYGPALGYDPDGGAWYQAERLRREAARVRLERSDAARLERLERWAARYPVALRPGAAVPGALDVRSGAGRDGHPYAAPLTGHARRAVDVPGYVDPRRPAPRAADAVTVYVEASGTVSARTAARLDAERRARAARAAGANAPTPVGVDATERRASRAARRRERARRAAVLMRAALTE